jgi:hypothetical protein
MLANESARIDGQTDRRISDIDFQNKNPKSNLICGNDFMSQFSEMID